MKSLKYLKLAHKLPLFIVGLGILVAATIITVSSIRFERYAIHSAEEKFKSIVADREKMLKTYIAGVNADILSTAAVPSTAQALIRLNTAWNGLGANPGQTLRSAYIDNNPNPLGRRHLLDRAADGTAYDAHHGRFHQGFRSLLDIKGYYDAFLINMAGDVIYSVSKEADYATNILNGRYKETGLGEVFRDAISESPGEVHFSNMAPYAPSDNIPAAFVSTTISSGSGEVVGVLILQLPIAKIGNIVSNPDGLGDSVELYLVDQDMRALTKSRFEDGHAILDQLPASDQITAALEGRAEFHEGSIGLRGQQVISYSDAIEFHEGRWAFVAEEDWSEVMAPVIAERYILAVTALITAALMSLAGWLFARSVTGPIDRICASMEQVAAGDLDIDVPEALRGDEIGKIGKTLVSLRNDLKTAHRAEETRAEQQREQEQVVEMLSGGLRNLSDGDLSKPLNTPFPAEYEQLRTNFNRTLETLKATMSEVINSAASIRNGANEISQASDDLSGRTESQAATLEQTAAALEEMTASVKSAAEGARSVENIVNEAKVKAEESGTVVQNAVSAMTKIADSSNHIGQIIGVIDDIAFQTNLLALNAGVEAARAGEAGRGFAVVASEVRALAQRSSDAASEIKTLISDSSNQVEQGVHLVGNAGEALTSIVEQVGHISHLVSEMAVGTAEQSTGLAEINIGVTQLDQVTQENAAMVEQATAASHLLTTDATKLSKLVAIFNIDGRYRRRSTDAKVVELATPTAHGSGWDVEPKPQPVVKAANSSGSADLWQNF